MDTLCNMIIVVEQNDVRMFDSLRISIDVNFKTKIITSLSVFYRNINKYVNADFCFKSEERNFFDPSLRHTLHQRLFNSVIFLNRSV